MQRGEALLIFGASARAAAFSALRAGLRPWCVDLFADADLRGRCPAVRLTGRYPGGFLEAERGGGPGPWMYTGGLENHPQLVQGLAARRRLWGNDGPVLRRCRQPAFLRDAARACGLPAPALPPPGRADPGRRYLLKPLHGAGGRDIAVWPGGPDCVDCTASYLQEYIDGTPAAAVFVAGGGTAVLLGLTRQLVGVGWLHAGPFAYCGSVGPLPAGGALGRALGRLGDRLAAEGGLRGLFGVDGVLRDGEFWPVEINPRYTASVEVLEYATGLRALHLHRLAFEGPWPPPDGPAPPTAGGAVGKAILFARGDGTFPAGGPWEAATADPRPPEEMPDFADVPNPGDPLAGGSPVLTLLQRGADEASCVAALRRRAAEVSAALGWPVAADAGGR